MNEIDQPAKPKWSVGRALLIGCGISLIVVCLVIGLLTYNFFTRSNPLDGEILLPSTVKTGEQFDLVVTVTNPTSKPIFLHHVVLHENLGMPSLLDGARVISVEPDMESDLLANSTNEWEFAYFQDIAPGETLTFRFHLQAETPGSYVENVAIYSKHEFLGDPFFSTAFYVYELKIEITP